MTVAPKHNSLDSQREIPQIITSTLLFSGVSEDIKHAFVEEARIKLFPKGATLFLHEDEASFFYIIEQGWIKLFRETLSGEEAIVDVLNHGHMFGETAIFENDSYAYGAQVIEDTVLVQLPLSLLKKYIAIDVHLSTQMLRVMSRFRKQQAKELEHRDLQSAPQRIGCFLLRLCDTRAKGAITLHLPYDKTLIASRLGMKAETLSRALAKLSQETGIVIQGSTVTIPGIEKLSSYSCRVCSSTYPCQDLY